MLLAATTTTALTLLTLLALAPSAAAYTVHGVLVAPSRPLSKEDTQRYLPIDADTRVQLALGSGARALLSTACRAGGAFELHDVPPGTHTLFVHSTRYLYPELLVSVAATSGGGDGDDDARIDVRALHDTSFVLKHPVHIAPVALVKLGKQEKEAFSLVGAIGMMPLLMIAVSVLLMFVMPKLTAALEEEKQEAAKDKRPTRHRARLQRNRADAGDRRVTELDDDDGNVDDEDDDDDDDDASDDSASDDSASDDDNTTSSRTARVRRSPAAATVEKKKKATSTPTIEQID